MKFSFRWFAKKEDIGKVKVVRGESFGDYMKKAKAAAEKKVIKKEKK